MSQTAPSEFSVLGTIEKKMGREIRPGDLGVVMARAGVGKTAFMVRMGLDELRSGRVVVHIALGQSLSEVHARYETTFEQTGGTGKLPPEMRGRLVIQSFADRILSASRLKRAHEDFSRHVKTSPSLILVDGIDWSSEAFGSQNLQELRQIGALTGACVCISARTHRKTIGSHPRQMPEIVKKYREEIAWAVFLEPVEQRFSVRLFYAFGNEDPGCELVLDSMPAHKSVLPNTYTLYSGGAQGTEAYFGECAERLGIEERNFTFEGRIPARQKGLVFLNSEQLMEGDVSISYVKSKMHRDFRESEEFRKVLQSIWHQVNPAAEVFSVGVILSDKTVKGGTGWAVELGKHLGKAIFVFDQDKMCWYEWKQKDWHAVQLPRIRQNRFAGTGTRSLSEASRQAVMDLFKRSF